MDRNIRIASDCRTAPYTKRARACHTTWGPFSSVQLAVEFAMKNDVGFVAPFIVRAAIKEEREYSSPRVSDIMDRVAKNIYQDVYKRCMVGTVGGYGDFRFT